MVRRERLRRDDGDRSEDDVSEPGPPPPPPRISDERGSVRRERGEVERDRIERLRADGGFVAAHAVEDPAAQSRSRAVPSAPSSRRRRAANASAPTPRATSTPLDDAPPGLEDEEHPRDASAGFAAELAAGAAADDGETPGGVPVGGVLAFGVGEIADGAEDVGAPEVGAAGDVTRQMRRVPPSGRGVPATHAAGAVALTHFPCPGAANVPGGRPVSQTKAGSQGSPSRLVLHASRASWAASGLACASALVKTSGRIATSACRLMGAQRRANGRLASTLREDPDGRRRREHR